MPAPMGRAKKGQATISTSTSEKSEEILSMRAQRIDGETRSGMLAKVVHWWLASGAPPVSKADAVKYCRIDKMLAIETARAVREWHEWDDAVTPDDCAAAPDVIMPGIVDVMERRPIGTKPGKSA